MGSNAGAPARFRHPWVRRTLPDLRGLLQPRRLVPALVHAARLTSAAVISYLVAHAIFPATQPLTGPLTSLLVVQATLFSTLTTGVRRVLSVVAGVLVAVLLSSWVGLTWWSLGTVIAVAIVLGRLLRLGNHLLEVPISAMLVLGVGSAAQRAATGRVVETLVGAGVGVLLNVVLPPPVRTRSASEAVERVATMAAALLDRAADELPAGVDADHAGGWLDDLRAMQPEMAHADQALRDAQDSRRLNPRAVGTMDADPVLRSGLDALEHSTVALRALFRSLADGLREGGASAYDDDVRGVFAVLLGDLATCLRTFTALVTAEADTSTATSPEHLEAALDALRETRVRLTELLLVDPRANTGGWELRGSLLTAVARVVQELDIEERGRQRERWQRELAPRSRPARTAARVRETSRQANARRRAK